MPEIKVKDPCKYCKKQQYSRDAYTKDEPPCNTCRYNTHSYDWRIPHSPYMIAFEEKDQ